MNGVTISARTQYVAKCGDCGRTETDHDSNRIDRWAVEHENEHIASRAIGPTLAGKVFDTDADDVKMFWHILPAAEAAGYSFLNWNGWIVTLDGAHVCREADVPGVGRKARVAS